MTETATATMQDETLYICKDLADKGYMRTVQKLAGNGCIRFTNNPPDDAWHLSWAFKSKPEQCTAIETGFFRTAAHLDQNGLYADSTFNQPGAMDEVLAFSAPESARDIVLDGSAPPSKYRQHDVEVVWDGIVLPTQIPFDRSIRSCGGEGAYWSFLRSACKKYGERLFLKGHPMLLGYIERETMDIAKEHGCVYFKTNHSVLKDCEFVITFNSTFCVDCFLHGVPVVQTAPGYFHKTGAVTYTDGELPDSAPDTTAIGRKLVDFLIWRYCFAYNQPASQWLEMLRYFSRSAERFPMPRRFCYALNRQYVNRNESDIF